MILHLGRDCFVTSGSILMILEYEEAVNNKDTSLFLQKMENKNICGDMKPRSIVVTIVDGHSKMYVSPISHKTLYKRSLRDHDNQAVLEEMGTVEQERNS